MVEEPKPSPQDETIKQVQKAMDACVLARAELYKVEMLLRACEKCMSNSKEAVK
jgi:hypothetical protein